ncbi:MAG: domain protein beta Propeller [Actinomycetia bacterium]|nr:domain protein beta Propeller [Actinomycetes bacterium]
MKRRNVVLAAAGAAALLPAAVLLPLANASAGGTAVAGQRAVGAITTVRVSVGSGGEQSGAGALGGQSISADGRLTVFTTPAPDLVPGDTNIWPDVYLHDAATGATTRVTTGIGGQPDSYSSGAAISGDGRFVAFDSHATNLVGGDTNAAGDVFRYEVATGAVTRVSVSSGEEQARRDSSAPSLSGDGRFVAFTSGAGHLVAGDTNGRPDAFVRDTLTGRTVRASIGITGSEGDAATTEARISGNGRFVAFTSDASSLAPGDANGAPDVFVYDRVTGETALVSATATGQPGDGASGNVAISDSGRFLSFTSGSSDLVDGDTNGRADLFVRDRITGQTTRLASGDGSVGATSISGNGRFVAFTSTSTDLVPGDTNAKPDAFAVDRVTGAVTRTSVAADGSEMAGTLYGDVHISGDGRSVLFSSDAANLVAGDTNERFDVFVRQFRV